MDSDFFSTSFYLLYLIICLRAHTTTQPSGRIVCAYVEIIYFVEVIYFVIGPFVAI